MSRLKIYDHKESAAKIVADRGIAYRSLTPIERFKQMMALIKLSKKLNHDEPLKQPQGLGLVLRKIRH